MWLRIAAHAHLREAQGPGLPLAGLAEGGVGCKEAQEAHNESVDLGGGPVSGPDILDEQSGTYRAPPSI